MSALHWIVYENPLVSSQVVYDLLDQRAASLTAASFQTLATSGYGPGQLTIDGVDDALIYEALNGWMLNRVQATDGAGFVAYEGFIAEVHATIGNYEYEQLVDSFASQMRVTWEQANTNNKGSATFTTLIPSGGNPYSPATQAQSKYCIKEEELDLTGHGSIPRAQAVKAGTAYLAQLVDPLLPHFKRATSQSLEPHKLELVLWGYATTLGWQKDTIQFRTNTDIAGVVKGILKLPTNQFIPSTTAALAGVANTTTTIRYNSLGSYKFLRDMINEVIQYGGASNARLLFQVWENRLAYLTAAPTDPGYFSRSDNERLWTAAHAAIQPWRLRAGQYMVAEDYPAPTESFSGAVSTDPRAYLIEQTNYDDLTGDWDAVPEKSIDTHRFMGRMRRLGRFLPKV